MADKNEPTVIERRAPHQADMDRCKRRIDQIEARGNKATRAEIEESARLAREWQAAKNKRDAIR